MKKIACLFAVFCLMAVLISCGGKADSSESAPAEAAETEGSESVQTASAVADESENTQVASAEVEEKKSGQMTASEEGSSESTQMTSAETASESGTTAEDAVPDETDAKGRLLYMGHASLRITTPEGKVIYIDPFAGQEGYEPAADLILVTHGHYDHYDLDKVADRNPDCRIITWQEALSDGAHQTFDLDFASVEAVEAGNNQYHSLDECVGYIVTLADGTSIYVTGDTSTTQQMSSLAEKEIDYAFFCCDGIYNMDLEEAAQCAKLVGAKHNIPYHMAAADSGALFDRSRAEQFDVPDLLIIEDGEEIELE